MPKVRKLEQAEIEKLEAKSASGERAAIAKQYDELVAEYNLGDFYEVTLEDGENRATVKNRISAAVRRRGWDLEFKRTRGDALRFKVVELKAEEVGA